MSKKTIWLLLALALVVGALIAPAAASAADSSTPSSTAAVSTAPATRAEFAMLAVNGLGLPMLDPSTPTFSDVSSDSAYYQFVEGATAAGLLQGLGGDVFAPDLQVSRQQVATILARYLSGIELRTLGYVTGADGTHYPSLDAWYAAEGEDQLAKFSDEGDILPVHRTGVAYLAMHGIVEGSDGLFSPFSPVTQAESVALIDRVAEATGSFTPAAAAPTITSITPANGLSGGGTTVYINGSNFTADSSVSFGYSAAVSVTVNSSTLITAVSPSGTDGSAVAVLVTTSAGVSVDTSADQFTYYSVDETPVVSSVSPATGGEGDTVTILGANFDPSSTVVYFGGAQAESVTYVNSAELLAVVPTGVYGETVRVLVVTSAGVSVDTSADQFTYYSVDETPVVSSVSPATGPESGGTTVLIYGANFTSDSVVYFGYEEATDVTVNNSTMITAVSPAGTAGTTVPVLVLTDSGTSSSTYAGDFTYLNVGTRPTITSISPSRGWEGDLVTITGTNFDGSDLAVYFGGTPAENVTYVSPTEVTAVVPAGTDGKYVQVSVVTDAGSSSNSPASRFLYTNGSGHHGLPFFPLF